MNAPLPQTFAGLPAKAALERKTNARLQFAFSWIGPERVFSHDVTAAMFVSQTSPVGFELFSYVNTFFCSNKFAQMLVTWLKKSTHCQNLTGKKIAVYACSCHICPLELLLLSTQQKQKKLLRAKATAMTRRCCKLIQRPNCTVFLCITKKMITWSSGAIWNKLNFFFNCKIFAKTKYLGFLLSKKKIHWN